MKLLLLFQAIVCTASCPFISAAMPPRSGAFAAKPFAI